ncbi:MAG: radical SAM protein, partial [Planctomycetota bacterium]
MATCTKCGRVSEEIAEVLSICVDCLREADDDFFAVLKKVHARSREEFGLPASAPCDPAGVQCSLCRNECRIPVGGRGYCGVRRNEGGRLAGGTAQGAAVSWYCDPLPTNCVADWVCAGGSGAGYPQWAYQRGAE